MAVKPPPPQRLGYLDKPAGSASVSQPLSVPVPPIPAATPFNGETSSGISYPWLTWLQYVFQMLSSQYSVPGPYANDAAAAAAGVAIGAPYYVTGATAWMVVRVS